MTTNRRTIPLILSATALAVTLLTSCSATSDATPAPAASSAAPAATTAPVADVTPAPDAPAVGATITTDAEVTAAQAAGLGVYTTTAGAQVVIDPAAPTPEVVLADARATGGATSAATSDESMAAADARLAVAERVADAGGKKLAFIVAGGRYDEDGNLTGTIYVVQTAAYELRAPGFADSPAGAVALAQGLIDAQTDPSQYEIVNLAG